MALAAMEQVASQAHQTRNPNPPVCAYHQQNYLTPGANGEGKVLFTKLR
jgi:hypothetical protein